MLFTELRFLFFFAVVFGAYWAMPRNQARKAWLLASSYLFYAAWDWRFLSLILISTAVDFAVGRGMAHSQEPARRRLLLCLSLLTNLGILGFFKYYNFFAESAAAFSSWLGLEVPLRQIDIFLPIGISFYTFQSLSYSIDIYRRRLSPTSNALDFALFVAFFPQLVAGPIVRASIFLPQLVEKRRLSSVNFRGHLTLFLVGYVKKACIADQVARVVDPVFAAPELYTTTSQWLASLLYSLQIYCDFSGYSDMAIASAGLLGYRLTDNFNFPYLARSFREFWRRWHISLSTWFRDYLYIPLGGNRGSGARVALNLWLVFLLCGLWHGSQWTFIVWGLWNGFFLSLERFSAPEGWPRWLNHGYLLLATNLGWVIFRSPDLPSAGHYLAGMLGLGSAQGVATQSAWWWLLLAAFAAVHIWLSREALETRVMRLPHWLFAAGYGAALALALTWAAGGYKPFIYFQF
jgi:alginate O-acetyltransferase complex protein AlgI